MYSLLLVCLGLFFLAVNTALVGVIVFLQKKTLMSEALGHAALPGLVLGFLLTGGDKDFFWLLSGIFISNVLAIAFAFHLEKHTKFKPDAVVALTLSVFYGLGVFCFSLLQNSTDFEQAGLDRYLLGRPAAISTLDVYALGIFTILIMCFVFFRAKAIHIILFDRAFAQLKNFPIVTYQILFSVFLVLGIGIGIQAVGAILMSAFLILPAVVARRFSYQLNNLFIIAIFINLFAVSLGLFLSYQNEKIATGAIIIFLLSSIAFLLFFFAPNNGLLIQHLQQKWKKIKMEEENILKTVYEILKENQDVLNPIPIQKLIDLQIFSSKKTLKIIKRLEKQKQLISNQKIILLTEQGFTKAEKIYHLHLLWEKYLKEKMDFQSDHVHNMAEWAEHLTTPELEKMLHSDLNT